MTDTDLAKAATELFALAKSCPENDGVQEKCWDFIFANIDTILRLALVGSMVDSKK